MASKVNVNALTVVHAGSDGVAPSFPDVCLTPAPPGPPIPIPYPNVARSSDTAQGTKSVAVEGNPIMVQEATFATSTGDEAGSAGGVASATTKGKAKFVNYSFDVKFEGKCVARLGDPMTHNELTAPNTPPFPEVQPPCPMVVTPSLVDEAQSGPAPAETYQVVWDKVNERQWVNLPSAWGDDCGTTVTLTAHVEPRVAGEEVRFVLLPDHENPPEVRPALLAAGPFQSDADGVVKIDLRLPIYGGARFRVSAKTKSMAAPLASPPITVWRRFFYQVTTMEPAPDGIRMDVPEGLIASMEEFFSPVFIDLQPSTLATGTTPYLENVATAQQEKAVRKAVVPDDRSPFKMHIVAIDNADRFGFKSEKLYRSSEVESRPFPKWTHDSIVRTAHFETQKGRGDWTPLADVHVVDLEGGQAIIRGRIPHPHPWSVLVRLEYLYQAGASPAGWAGGVGTLYLCIGRMRRRRPEPQVIRRLRQAMPHEIGHVLGLVPETASWHDPAPRDHDYHPKHCHNMTAGSPDCLMWCKILEDRSPPFCTTHEPKNCAHFLRATDYSQVKWF